jgi:TRAP-type C4-dicarboxylate transport system permease small subunit
VQVAARTFLPQSPVWTEELTRFALLYLAACGVGPALRTGELVNVDLVVSLFPPALQRALQMFAAAATAALGLMLIGPSLDFTAIGRLQTSPALEWPMNTIHVITLIVSASIALFALTRLVEVALAPAATGER